MRDWSSEVCSSDLTVTVAAASSVKRGAALRPRLALVGKAALRFTLDGPATVTVLVNQKTRIVVGEPKGSFRISYPGTVAQVSAEAQDAAGNLSAVVSG